MWQTNWGDAATPSPSRMREDFCNFQNKAISAARKGNLEKEMEKNLCSPQGSADTVEYPTTSKAAAAAAAAIVSSGFSVAKEHESCDMSDCLDGAVGLRPESNTKMRKQPKKRPASGSQKKQLKAKNRSAKSKPLTRNAYLNFLHMYKIKHQNLTMREAIRKGAQKWRTLPYKTKLAYILEAFFGPKNNRKRAPRAKRGTNKQRK